MSIYIQRTAKSTVCLLEMSLYAQAQSCAYSCLAHTVSIRILASVGWSTLLIERNCFD